MGTARKVRSKASPGAKEAVDLADPTGMTGELITGKASARTFLDPNANLPALKKFGDSLTGRTSQRNKAAKQASKEEAAKQASKTVSDEAGKIREGAVAKKIAAESRSRDVGKVESEKIARSGVRDIKTDKLSGAGADFAVTEAAKVGPAATIAQAPQAQFRTQQQTLGSQLAATAAGQGTTPAQLQLQQATEQNIAQQAAMRAGASGAGAALARREIGRVGAQTAQQGAQQGALLRAQETAQAQQQLGQLAGQARGQDIGLATSQAGLEQQTSLQRSALEQEAGLQQSAQQQAAFLQSSAQEQQAMLATADQNLRAQLANQGIDLDVLKDNARRGDAASLANVQSQLQQVGMNDAMIKAYMQQELGAAGVQAGITTAQQQIAAGQTVGQQQAAGQQQAGMMGALGALGSAAIMASDINLKTNIKDGKKSIGDFLSSLSSSDYEYKDEKFGKGKQTSVMAQDLEKSETGKKAVIETKAGKMVDYAKLLPAMLAGLAESHHKIMSLEDALKAKKKGNR